MSGFFRKLFGKRQLNLPEKFRNALIHPMTTGLTTIRIGETLHVDNGWSAVIVAKGKVTDVFPSGQHILSIPMIPNTSRVLRLTKGKVRKKGEKQEKEFPTKFKCDLYYVNMDIFKNMPWHSASIGVRSKRYGMYRTKMNGFVDFQVVRPLDFVKLFLYEWSHIPSGKGEKYLAQLISEEVTLRLMKSDYCDPNDFLDSKKMADFLVSELNDNFSRFGIKIDTIRIDDTVILGKVGAQIEQDRISEGKGNTGLATELKKQIDLLNEKDGEVEFEEEMDLSDGRDYLSKEKEKIIQEEGIDLKNIVRTQLNKQKEMELEEKHTKDVDDLAKNKAHLLTREQESREIADEISVPDTEVVSLKNSKVAVTVKKGDVKKSQSSVCPICGGVLLGGVCMNCMNCESKKEKEE